MNSFIPHRERVCKLNAETVIYLCRAPQTLGPNPPPNSKPLCLPDVEDTDLFSRSTSSSPSLRIPEASSSAATVAEEDFGERSGQPQSKRVRLLTASEVQARDSRQTSESAPLAATLRLVEPGERLTRTPIPSPSTPYLQSWTRTLPDGRMLRVLNRVPRPPRYLTTEFCEPAH